MVWPVLPHIPTQSIKLPSGQQVDVLRLDQTDEFVSGNKWFKLKHNILKAHEQGFDTILTFGGAYSNHIYATAAVCKKLGLKSIGIIRGEEHLPLNPTLSFAKSCGMTLHYIDRSTYRDKYNSKLIEQFKSQFGSFYLIPEGGTNSLATEGTKEIPTLFEKPYDYVAISAGTGGTVAGILDNNICVHTKVLVFTALKGGDFLREEIENLLGYVPTNLELITDYHFGGYAKTKPALIHFINEIKTIYDLPLEPIYTGKAFYGLLDLIEKKELEPDASILFIHTGGLQGNSGGLLEG